MKVIKGFAQIDAPFQNAILTIGNFDGVHLGHQKILKALVAEARRIDGTVVVYTFRPHPDIALHPDRVVSLINTYDEKVEILRSLGVDVVIEEPFSREFSTIDPEKYFREVLIAKIGAVQIVVGYDFGFGKNRTGNIDMLKRLCLEKHLPLTVTKAEKVDGQVCSSTKIRESLLAGDVAKAKRLLGRPFFYRDIVVRGQGRGHKIGFSTANILIHNKVEIQCGVYATTTLWRGREYPSVTNIGRQPTFNGESKTVQIVVETHLIDFQADLYGEKIEIQFNERIRDEIKFAGVDELVLQIAKDVKVARKLSTCR